MPTTGSLRRAGLLLALLASLLALPAGARALTVGTQADGGIYQSAGIDAGVYLEHARQLEIPFERVALRWGWIARNCGAPATLEERGRWDAACYDWAMVDRAIGASERRIVFSVRETPCWVFEGDLAACPGEGAGSAYVGATPAQRGHFAVELAAFHRAAAERYSGRHGQRRVNEWTVWNEPNGATFWSENITSNARSDQPATLEERGCHYAYVYRAVVDALRGVPVEGGARVAFGALAPAHDPVAFLRGALGARGVSSDPAAIEACGTAGAGTAAAADAAPVIAAEDIDAVAIHPYPQGTGSAPFAPCPSDGGANRTLQCISRFVEEIDGFEQTRGAEVWALETAYESQSPFQPDGLPPLEQALRVGQSFARLAEEPRVTLASWYSMVDGACTCDWESGVVAGDYHSKKPAFLAMQAPLAVRDLGGGRVRVWALSHRAEDGADLQLLFASDCRHDRRLGVAHYGFRPLVEVQRASGAAWADIGPLEPLERGGVRHPLRSFCVAVGSRGGAVAASAIVSVDRTFGPEPTFTPYFVAPRRIQHALVDPRGDTVRPGMADPPAFESVPQGAPGAGPVPFAAVTLARSGLAVAADGAVRMLVQEVDAPDAQFTEVTTRPLISPGAARGLEETVVRHWFNPAGAGSFDLTAHDPRGTWDEVFLPDPGAAGWAAADPPNIAAGTERGALRRQALGEAPTRRYAFAQPGDVRVELAVGAQSTADWSVSLPVELVPDGTAPVGPALRVTDRGDSVAVATDPGTDAESGIASQRVERRDCGAPDDAWTAVVTGGDEQLAATLSQATCSEYRLVISDRVGNLAIAAP